MTREQKILENLGLVYYLAEKYTDHPELKEELCAEGQIGLIKAVDTYHEERQVKFATYAGKCIENEMKGYLRKNIKKKESLINRTELIPEYENELQKMEDYEMLYCALDRLTARERQMIEMRFGLGRYLGKSETQKGIAKIFGISQSKMSREEAKILKQLRQILNEEFI